jgi:hypothetical protein
LSRGLSIGLIGHGRVGMQQHPIYGYPRVVIEKQLLHLVDITQFLDPTSLAICIYYKCFVFLFHRVAFYTSITIIVTIRDLNNFTVSWTMNLLGRELLFRTTSLTASIQSNGTTY